MAIRNPKVKSRVVMTVFEGGMTPHTVEFFGEPIGVGDLERLVQQAWKERKKYHLSKVREDQTKRKEQEPKEEESNG